MKEEKVTPINMPDLPADAYVAPEQDSDEKLLEKLLGTPDESTKSVFMKRFGAEFVVKAISSEKNARTHQIEEKTNQEMLSNLLILTACTKPNWNDPKLLAKYNTSDPAKVIKKRLYIGEISQLTEAIMDVSGFDDGLEEAKNSLAEAEKQQ